MWLSLPQRKGGSRIGIPHRIDYRLASIAIDQVLPLQESPDKHIPDHDRFIQRMKSPSLKKGVSVGMVFFINRII